MAAPDSPTQPSMADDTMPHWDRFDPRTVDARRTESGYNMYVHNGFEPTTLEEEKLLGGWLRTTAPEGAPYSELNELYMAGSRGAESRLTKRTVGRTQARRRSMLHSSPNHQPSGDDFDDGNEPPEY